MVLYLLDVAPISSWEQIQRAEARKKAELEKKQYEKMMQEKKQQEELQKQQEKAENRAKKAHKAKKKAEKAKKKAEKAKKKAEKAEKKAKKAEKQAIKNVKNLSSAALGQTTVEVPAGQPCETACAAMPTGVVLTVCASLLICCGSAWFFRRFNSDSGRLKVKAH